MGVSPFNPLSSLLCLYSLWEERFSRHQAGGEHPHSTDCQGHWRSTVVRQYFHFPSESSHHWKPTSNQKTTVTQCHRVIPDCSSIISIWWHHQGMTKISLARFTKWRLFQRRVFKLYILKIKMTYLTFHHTCGQRGTFCCSVRGF